MMQRVLPATHTVPLHGARSTRQIEEEAGTAPLPHTLMQRAGVAVARLARALAPHARCAWVAAGPGNNGGDGLEAALHLHRAGLAVSVNLAADPHRLPTDARMAFERARDGGVPFSASATDPPPSLDSQDIAIDALLGLGLTRAPSGALASLIGQLATLPCHVLAVDLPSGLDADTGRTAGPACVRATHTLSLLTVKPGLFTGRGRDHAGMVWLDTLGVDTVRTPPDAWLSGSSVGLAPRRLHAQHKGSFGDLAVVGGAAGMTGAALLAARAAHAAGAGRVFVDLLDETGLQCDPLRPELMFRHAWWRGDATTLAGATVICGCGGGDRVRSALPRLLSIAPRLVLDADALNAIAADSGLRTLLSARARRGLDSVLTPHPLEAARLLATDAATVQANRLEAAQQLADEFGCTILLKGSGSVIAAPASIPWINPTGNASLATAGTGDVLAGWLGGCWSADPAGGSVAAARRAAWSHGHAADACTVAPLRAADLIEAMHQLQRHG